MRKTKYQPMVRYAERYHLDATTDISGFIQNPIIPTYCMALSKKPIPTRN